jgi:hypothetical protein
MLPVTPHVVTTLARADQPWDCRGLPALTREAWARSPRRFCLGLGTCLLTLTVVVLLAMVSVAVLLAVGGVVLVSLTIVSFAIDEDSRTGWQQFLVDAGSAVFDFDGDDDWDWDF